jgi:hypothetical protein
MFEPCLCRATIMNANPSDALPDDARFDRLVDSELSEAQRRELLVGLDDEPGGWRRCALAFLEAQTWKESLSTRAEPPIRASAPPHSRWTARTSTALAMAASFLIALWVGSIAWQRPIGQQVTQTDSSPTIRIADATPARPSDADIPAPKSPAASPDGPWRLVTVSSPGGPAGKDVQFNLPAVERDSLDPQWLRSEPQAIPADVLQALRQSGHQVEQHREFVPMPLKDGRQLVVPVDKVNIRYVGTPAY